MANQRRAAWLILTALLGAVSAAASARAEEPPPAQGTRLHFQKTLYIQATPKGKVFAETHQVNAGDSVSRILAQAYGIAEDSQPALAEAFRAINPGVDPNRLPVGQVVRIPFKIEEAISGPPREGPPQATVHTVRAGESLWRILKNRYRVAKDTKALTDALTAVARANPDLRDPNHLVPGQKIVIPAAVVPGPPAERAPEPLPSSVRAVLDLLKELNCQVADQGETFIPLSRGRSVRLDGRDFPVVTGPSGRRLILDARSRLSPALARSVEEDWGLGVIRGTEISTQAQLEKILPRMGFHELSRGERKATIGRGVELVMRPEWTVVPRPKDLWEGSIHLLFSEGTVVSPAAGSIALKAGFTIHTLGSGATRAPKKPEISAVPEIGAFDPAQGAAAILDRLRIPSRVRAEVECDLGGGVSYRVRPELTFQYGGLSYAVLAHQKSREEGILARAGYLTLTWQEGAPLLNDFSDLLALVGRRPVRRTVEAPGDEAVGLRVEGLVLEDPGLGRALYPALPEAEKEAKKVLLTEAELSPAAAALFIQMGILPWRLRTR